MPEYAQRFGGQPEDSGGWHTVSTYKTRDRALSAARWQRKGTDRPVRIRHRGRGSGYDVQVQY